MTDTRRELRLQSVLFSINIMRQCISGSIEQNPPLPNTDQQYKGPKLIKTPSVQGRT